MDARDEAAERQYFEAQQAAAELTETRNEVRERRSAVRAADGPPQGSIEAFLSRLLPRTDLDADTVETLLDWPSPAAGMDLLRQVDVRAEPRGKKPLVKKERLVGDP